MHDDRKSLVMSVFKLNVDLENTLFCTYCNGKKHAGKFKDMFQDVTEFMLYHKKATDDNPD